MTSNPNQQSPVRKLEVEMRNLAAMDYQFRRGEADRTYFSVGFGDVVADQNEPFDRLEVDYKFSAVRFRSNNTKAIVRYNFGVSLTSENSEPPLPVAVKFLEDSSDETVDPATAQEQVGLVTFEKSLNFTYWTDDKILFLCEMYQYKDEDDEPIVTCCACEDDSLHDEEGEVVDYDSDSSEVLDVLKENVRTQHEKVEYDDIESAVDYWRTQTVAASLLQKNPSERAASEDERALLGLSVLRATRHALHSKVGFIENTCRHCLTK